MWLVYYLLADIVCGIVCYIILSSKGYGSEEYPNYGFWWGFLLSVIGIIICACKTDIRLLEAVHKKEDTGDINRERIIPQSDSDGFWRCPKCGMLYSKYANECKCGYKKEENNNETETKSDGDIISQLKNYKELLDNGTITEEEFTNIKKKILNM